MDAEPIIIVGGGLAGLVACYEATRRKVPCVIVDQENENNLGGQAFWSLGGIFCVDSSDQRRLGVKDSRERAMADWFNSAQFDREREDHWPRQWAKAFVDFATDEMEPYLKKLGVSFQTVGWAERGDGRAEGHGNSVPRFHLTWGTGPEIVRVFAEPVKAAAKKGLVTFKFRHRVDEIISDSNGRAIGVRGKILEQGSEEQGEATSRVEVSDFEIRGSSVLVASGGIGGNVDKVKEHWPKGKFGARVPESFVVGVPAHVDGRMIDISEQAGASIINRDRMWHYTEGLKNWNPIWPNHGIRIIPGPSSLWLDATGQRLPPFLYPGADTLATLKYICSTGHDYTWFVLNRHIISREFSLSGSEQNPDITNKSYWELRHRVFGSNGSIPVQNFQKYGEDFVVRKDLPSLVEGMNELARTSNGPVIKLEDVERQLNVLNMNRENKYSKDGQQMFINNARNYWPENWMRISKPHNMLDPKYGPLIAVRLHLITRKTLGGLETDLDANVIRPDGTKFTGLYAAGECAGFGGGGVHGYNALEGTFLGGCIFSGRAAGRAMAANHPLAKEGIASKL